jgi:membrane-associated phospholipid phosphatase
MNDHAGTLIADSDAETRVEEHGLADVTLRWSDLGLFIASYLALVAIWVAIGEGLTRSTSIESADQSVAEWFVDTRTAGLDTLSVIGSNLADTMVKIAFTALVAIAMGLAWKRWREPLMLVAPLVLEASAFITITFLVSRPRPDVERLETSPVDTSFPSGHVAAGAAYGALIIIVFWHTRRTWARMLIVALSIAVPAIVGWARLYRGMHHLTDVIAGVVLGVVSVVLCWLIIRHAVARTEMLEASSVEHGTRPASVDQASRAAS